MRTHSLILTGWITVYVLISFWVPFSWPLYLFFLAGLVPILWLNPKAGIVAMLLSTMLWERWFTLQPIVLASGAELKFYPLDAVLVLVGLASVAAWWRHKTASRLRPTKKEKRIFQQKVLRSSSTLRLLIGFFVILGGSFLWSLVQEGDVALIGSAAKQWYWYAGMTFILLLTIRTKRDLLLIEKTIVFGSILAILFLALAFLRGEGLWTEYQPLSTGGVRLLSQTHAFFLLFGSFFLLNRWMRVRGRTRWLLTSLIAVQWVGVLLSLTRHLYVALPVGLAVFAWFHRTTLKQQLEPWRRWIMGIGATVIGVLVIAFIVSLSVYVPVLTPVQERIASFTNTQEDASTSYRLVSWGEALHLWQDSPWLGIGFGQRMQFPFQEFVSELEVRGLHNDPLSLLVQGGILLFIAFCVLIAALFRAGYRVVTTHKDADLRQLAVATLAGLAVFLTASLFSTYFILNIFMLFFWVLVGLLLLLESTQTATERV